MSEFLLISLLRRALKSRIGRIITHSGFIATLLGALVFYLLGFNRAPYIFEIQGTNSIPDPPGDVYNYYADLNLDANPQRFLLANGVGLNSMLKVYPFGTTILDQWNFQGMVSKSTIGYYIGNYDRDSSLEIVCFSQKENLILLNIVEPYGDLTHPVKNRLVDTIGESEPDAIVQICDARFFDLNRDGSDELIFSLFVNLGYQPRKLYAYDIKADSIWSSPLSGTGYSDPLILDFDGDGRYELFCTNYSSKNYYGVEIAYPDTCSWFVVLDDHLNYRVPPVPTGGEFGAASPLLFKNGEAVNLHILVSGNQNRKYPSWYKVYPDFSIQPEDPDKNSFYQRILTISKSASGEGQLFRDKSGEKRYIVLNNVVTDSILLDYNSNEIQIFNYQAGLPRIEYAILEDGDRQSILFLDKHLKNLGELDLNTTESYFRICWAGKEDGIHQFLLSSQNKEFLVSVSANPWQYWQYLILLGLIGGFFGFINFIRFIQSQQIARQENARKEVLEYQLKAVRNQLDPHFTFNALNTLSALSMSGDKMGVDHFINHFSRLLRTHLHNSDQILVPLKDEIEFVMNYVELQRIRFENGFCLELNVDDDADLGFLIPKMLIQNHVENAIKHGLTDYGIHNPNENLGRLRIDIREEDKSLVIIVEDNGVGRGNSHVPDLESTGTGNHALEKIRESMKALYGIRIRQEVEDLFGENCKPAGTRIIIRIIGND